MKSLILLIFICCHFLKAEAQDNKNKPRIEGQENVSTNEDQAFTIQFSHLDVRDRDDWFYPWGFTMKLYPGSGYSVNGSEVIPDLNFNGTLVVPVTVNDGDSDSEKFDFKITVIPVNDKPVITGHSSLSTNENEPVTIELNHLTVTDPDNTYPDDFSLRIGAGNNYTTSGAQVVPESGFTGRLSVNLTVNDGQAESDNYQLPIQVNAVDRVPEIVSQATLNVAEDESLNIQLTHLTVRDNDSHYPEGFTLSVSAGENYTVSKTTITPMRDFHGKISVTVTVSDGKNTSSPFKLSVTVIPVNDIPEVTDLETEPIFFGAGNLSTPVSESVIAKDVDGDSIMFAEVGIRPEGYNINSDRLAFTPPANSKIRGVFDPDTGILTLLGQASPASYTLALRSVHYNVVAEPLSESKVLYIVINDGKSDSEAKERTLTHGEASISLEIPSGFTPNGDLANDTWKIVPLKSADEYSKAKIRVYNKSGSVVYESIGFEKEWDGRMNGELLPADMYFYTIDLNLNTPNSFVKGIVTILR